MNTVTFLSAMNLGERFAYAGRMTLIGMMTIFVALSILWGALVLFRKFVQRGEVQKDSKPVAPVAPAAPVPAPVAQAKATNDGELVAAITAAVSLMLAEENGGRVPNFRVVSFRRSRGNNK
ncbi:MAG: OadG family protein [Clostridia bacterium]|nr:OadG family protein [Clostridia bacterium]